MEAIWVFLAAVLVGYFLLPVFLKKEALHFFLAHSTNFESAWRDRFLKPFTDNLKVSPNAVTLAGFGLVFWLVYLFVVEARPGLIFTAALLAGFTDMLDGSLARNSGRVTRLGAVLDVSRDASLALVISYFLWQRGLLSFELIFWFFLGWFFLGVIRLGELKISGSLAEDYKFALDRIRLTLAWVGVLFLLFLPYNDSLGRAAEILFIAAIAISWLSLLFHSAHLRFLKEEKLGVW